MLRAPILQMNCTSVCSSKPASAEKAASHNTTHLCHVKLGCCSSISALGMFIQSSSCNDTHGDLTSGLWENSPTSATPPHSQMSCGLALRRKPTSNITPPIWGEVQARPWHFTFKAITQGNIVTGLDPAALDVTRNYWANSKMKICFALLQVFSDLKIWIKSSRSMSPSLYPNALIKFCIYSQYCIISSSCPGSIIHGKGTHLTWAHNKA